MGDEVGGCKPRAKYLRVRPGEPAAAVENDNAPAFTVTRGELGALVRDAVSEALSRRESAPRPALLDREALAAVLGCSAGLVDKLRRRGLPHYRIGDSPRFDLDAVLQWIWKDNETKKAGGQ